MAQNARPRKEACTRSSYPGTRCHRRHLCYSSHLPMRQVLFRVGGRSDGWRQFFGGGCVPGHGGGGSFQIQIQIRVLRPVPSRRLVHS
ncbi:hypothetical protein EUGRSUZ_G02599 [Eucalyptus grandis]|uniref:Uncharacterized protein n=2 Tax=Eucalyptus grandis TaxID=71139 RepID=A0ACC3K6U6_EUCGR|nr:hypothetical protein EUGRSUZ_G02599 [Eucalyptus grandis]